MELKAKMEETKKVAAVTHKQWDYYRDLVRKKKEPQKDKSEFNFDTISAEISRLEWEPPTDDMIETIERVTAELKGIGIGIKAEEGMSKRKAGKYIESLLAMHNLHSDKLPPHEKQIKWLADMYAFPGVPFEDFKIERRIKLKGKNWRRPSREEFENSIKSNLTKAEASRLIDEYRGEFSEWRATRATTGQKNMIRTLEARMSVLNGETSSEYEFVDGKLIPVNAEASGLDDFALDMLSEQEADKHIDKLKAEVKRAELRSSFVTEEDKSLEKASKKHDTKNKASVAHKLMALVGYEVPELVECFEESGDKLLPDKAIALGEFLEANTDKIEASEIEAILGEANYQVLYEAVVASLA